MPHLCGGSYFDFYRIKLKFGVFVTVGEKKEITDKVSSLWQPFQLRQ